MPTVSQTTQCVGGVTTGKGRIAEDLERSDHGGHRGTISNNNGPLFRNSGKIKATVQDLI